MLVKSYVKRLLYHFEVAFLPCTWRCVMEIWTYNNHPSAYHRKLKCNIVCSIFCCHFFIRRDSNVREMVPQMLRISNSNMSRLPSPRGGRVHCTLIMPGWGSLSYLLGVIILAFSIICGKTRKDIDFCRTSFTVLSRFLRSFAWFCPRRQLISRFQRTGRHFVAISCGKSASIPSCQGVLLFVRGRPDHSFGSAFDNGS